MPVDLDGVQARDIDAWEGAKDRSSEAQLVSAKDRRWTALTFSLVPFLYISCPPPSRRKQTGQEAYPNRLRRRRSQGSGIRSPLHNLRFLPNRSRHLQQPRKETLRNHLDRIRLSTTSPIHTLTPTSIRPCRTLYHPTLTPRCSFRKDRFLPQSSLTNQRNSTTRRISRPQVNLPPRHSLCRSHSITRHLAVTPRTGLLADSTSRTRI